MVSLNQLDKVREMLTQGWSVIPRTNPQVGIGGPVLLRNGEKYVLVYASNELVTPTPDEISGW